jgi:hypothetical protein
MVIKLDQTMNHAGHRLGDLRFDFPKGSRVNIKEVEYLISDMDYVWQDNIDITQQFHLIKLPYLWGTFDEKDAVQNTEVLQTLLREKIHLKPDEPLILSIDPSISKEKGNYIHLKILALDQAEIKLYYADPEGSYFTFDTIPSSKPEDYLVRVSTQWQWINGNADEMIISSTEDITIYEVYIREGD